MSKNVALFIDVANLYYSARGQEVDVDYVALLKHATKGRDLIRAYAYSGLDPENENQRKFLDFLSKNGYKVVSKDIRKFGDGRVKANLDIELVVDLFRLADRMDIAVIVSGDGDFASAIRALQDVGVRCEVISFRPNTSSDLIAVADEFTDIMKILGIGRKKGEKGQSMPEMPAKEVNPEFGFRTASRDVAAAALAAIRDGETTPARRRGGRGGRGSRATEAPAAVPVAVAAEDEPVEPMTSLEAHVEPGRDAADAEIRHRRRRRGGRGRGRGHRQGSETGEVAAEGAAGELDEITWEELDDISQLGELTDLGEPGDEREYAFREADASTLAELGLPAEPMTAAPAEAPREEAGETAEPKASPRSRSGGRRRAAPKDERTQEEAATEATSDRAAPRRRRRTAATAAAAESTGTPDAQPAEGMASAERGTRTRRRTRAAATPGGSAHAGSTAAPARRRSRGTKAGAQPAADQAGSAGTGEGPGSSAAGEDEGIWQRFRSGRRTTRGSRSS